VAGQKEKLQSFSGRSGVLHHVNVASKWCKGELRTDKTLVSHYKSLFVGWFAMEQHNRAVRAHKALCVPQIKWEERKTEQLVNDEYDAPKLEQQTHLLTWKTEWGIWRKLEAVGVC